MDLIGKNAKAPCCRGYSKMTAEKTAEIKKQTCVQGNPLDFMRTLYHECTTSFKDPQERLRLNEEHGKINECVLPARACKGCLFSVYPAGYDGGCLFLGMDRQDLQDKYFKDWHIIELWWNNQKSYRFELQNADKKRRKRGAKRRLLRKIVFSEKCTFSERENRENTRPAADEGAPGIEQWGREETGTEG